MSCTGVGSTLVFSGGNISFTSRIKSIGSLRRFVEALDDTSLASTDHKEFCPATLAEIDPVDVEFFYAGFLPTEGATGTAVLTIVKESTQIQAATFTGTVFIQEVVSPQLESGTRKMASMQFRFDGKTFAFTPAA